MHHANRTRVGVPQTAHDDGANPMRAMVLEQPGEPLRLRDVASPTACDGQVLIRVAACGVCRTDLHIVDGELPDPKLPLIPGHQVVGTIIAAGRGADRYAL